MTTFRLEMVLLGLVIVIVGASASTLPDWWYTKAKNFQRVCRIGNHKTVRVGETWHDRCMKCVCDQNEGALCDGPKCAIPYKSYHNKTCIKWSMDECCCEEFGCRSGDKVYQIGQSYPFPENDPCGECLCEQDTDFPRCRKKICPPLVCVDAVRIPGECCERCLRGPNCRYPELSGGNTTFQDLQPLLLTTSRMIQSVDDPLMFYDCRCMIPGGVATCKEAPFMMSG